MMAGELYEMVPGIELQPGDRIRARPTDEPDGIVGEQVADVYRLRPDLKVFRRHTGHHPDVLMRALENLRVAYDGVASLYGFENEVETIDQLIAEAEAEIAKERGSNE